ncbi:aspartate decarboxylase [Achromatium sp. WMS2]|nr:aspartate decarboxylase [Achromatium sp. WMS2]
MQLTILKCKLHRACVTHSELEYEGSCAIDSKLMELAGIHEYEQIHIYNVTNGERFSTYAILADPGSRIISINGAAAHKASPGDRVIICTYAVIEAGLATTFRPKLVYLNENNIVTHINNNILPQSA